MDYLQTIDIIALFTHLLYAEERVQEKLIAWDSVCVFDPSFDVKMTQAEIEYLDAVDHYLWVKDEVIRRNAVKLFNDFSQYLYERGLWGGLSKEALFIQNR